jgi:hypothetical protein
MLMGHLELRYEHLGRHRDTPARRERCRQLQERIDQIWAEQELLNEARVDTGSGFPSLQVTDRYAQGRIHL